MSHFKAGDRVFSHYTMKWGNVVSVDRTEQVRESGVLTSHTDTWYSVRWDDGTTDLMNDGGTRGWSMCRIMPPHIAERNGWGKDPGASN